MEAQAAIEHLLKEKEGEIPPGGMPRLRSDNGSCYISREFRYATTVLFAVLSALLILLWVRSYFYSDFLRLQSHSMEWVASSQFGNVLFAVADGVPSARRWQFATIAAGPLPPDNERLPPGFSFKYGSARFMGTCHTAPDRHIRRTTLDALAIRPQHTANRHDAGGGGARNFHGVDVEKILIPLL